jgi:hypothetical protein
MPRLALDEQRPQTIACSLLIWSLTVESSRRAARVIEPSSGTTNRKLQQVPVEVQMIESAHENYRNPGAYSLKSLQMVRAQLDLKQVALPTGRLGCD